MKMFKLIRKWACAFTLPSFPSNFSMTAKEVQLLKELMQKNPAL
jgi:hypothetical protein